MKSTLEVLREAERTLSGKAIPYEFHNWQCCTCGHIYMGTGEDIGFPSDPRPYTLYERVAIETATALGWRSGGHPSDGNRAVCFISDQTARHGGALPAALRVMREAIAKIEAAEEEARLKIVNEHNFALK